MRMSSASERLRTSKPHGHRMDRTGSFTRAVLSHPGAAGWDRTVGHRGAMDDHLPLAPVGVHPDPHLGLALEQVREELLDLRRSRESLDPLEARPLVDPEERPGIPRVQEHAMREVTRLLRGV